MQTHTLSKLAASLLLCGLVAQAGAQTVVLDTYHPDIGYLEGWPTQLGQGRSVAAAFSLSSATSIQSLLTTIYGSGGVTLGVLARTGDVPTGSNWLHSIHLLNPEENTTLTPSGWTLAAGNYWLAAVADDGFEGQWQSATNNPTGIWAASTDGTWSTMTSLDTGMPGARITVSAVPEPSTYGLMLAGGLLVAAAARRKARHQG